jgi:serine/threonine protein kinase
VLHRDIKPENFLVISISTKAPVSCKITDFGTSRYAQSTPHFPVADKLLTLLRLSTVLSPLCVSCSTTHRPWARPSTWPLRFYPATQTADSLFDDLMGCILVYRFWSTNPTRPK